MTKLILLLCLTLSLSAVGCGGGAVPSEFRPSGEITRWDDSLWAGVLDDVTTDDGLVRWEKLKENEGGVRDRLYEYVGLLGAASPASDPGLFPTADDRLAYHINAYNALCMYGIVRRGYPGNVLWANPAVPGALFFTDQFVVGGRKTNLDSLEQRRVLDAAGRDPRLHFAVNCMSYSCPPLRREPFDGDRLDEQLDDQGDRYLTDPRAVVIDGDKARLNSIFTNFYKGDFIDAARERGTPDDLLSAVQFYAPDGAPILDATDVGSQGYDWSLNAPR